ncbi:MAG: MFS transporter [Candidatus Solibacter usitatus]|nr:MFS transporter [Candidatus Solibacter usitatus]
MDAYASFRSRDYRLLIAGNFLSGAGLQMLSVAVGWDLYLATKSAIVLGNVGLVQVAPFVVFALLAGRIADRHDRRRVIVVTQLLLLAASALLIAASGSVLLIYTGLFFTASARAFQGPSRSAMLPHIVPAGALQNAITWNSSAMEIANVSGPALAGILIAAAGSRSVYLVHFLCATLTLICFFLLDFRADAGREVAAPSGKALLEGVHFIRKDALILPAISLDLFAVLFGGATALLPVFAIDILHTGARGLGWLRAAPSIGAVSMAFLMAHSPKIQNAGRVLLLTVAGFGAATILFGLSRSLWLSFAMLLLTGAFDNVSVVLRHSLVQSKTPDRLRGRVLAANNIFISCSNQLGAVESGWTAAWFGPVASVVAGGAATIAIVTGFAAKSRSLREWKQ